MKITPPIKTLIHLFYLVWAALKRACKRVNLTLLAAFIRIRRPCAHAVSAFYGTQGPLYYALWRGGLLSNTKHILVSAYKIASSIYCAPSMHKRKLLYDTPNSTNNLEITLKTIDLHRKMVPRKKAAQTSEPAPQEMPPLQEQINSFFGQYMPPSAPHAPHLGTSTEHNPTPPRAYQPNEEVDFMYQALARRQRGAIIL